MPQKRLNAKPVPGESKSGHKAQAMGGDKALVANSLWPCQDIGDMHLYQWDTGSGQAGQTVGQGKACVGESPGIDNHAGNRLVVSLFQPV